MRSIDVPIPPAPTPPFPIMVGYTEVTSGFGRGSADLGIPTANIDINTVPAIISNSLALGVYLGYCQLIPNHKAGAKSKTKKRPDGAQVHYNYGHNLQRQNNDLEVLPMVMSIGKNPFYNKQDPQNAPKTLELHIMHNFTDSFYGALIKFFVLAHIRPELDYTTKQHLIEDIHRDIQIANDTLSTKEYSHYKQLL